VVADSQLTLEQQDLFTANQVIHLKPLVGQDVFSELLAANPFVARFYPNFQPPASSLQPLASSLQPPASRLKAAIEAVFRAPSLLVELACRHAYGSYLRRRAGSWRSPEQVRLQADCLKLHTRSHRRSILERFDCAVREAVERAEGAA
jgi:hypothetical protein